MSQVKFNFFLKNNPNNKRELPIVMTITMSGERTQMFTGLWTIRSKWNNKYNKVIGYADELVYQYLQSELFFEQSFGCF